VPAVRVLQGYRPVATAGQCGIHERHIGALAVEVHHLTVIILKLIQHDCAAGGRIGLARDDVLVEEWFVPLIIDIGRWRHERVQSQLALRFSGQLLLEGVKDFLNVFFAMRNLQESNDIRISELAGRGEPRGLADHSAATNRCAHAGLP